MIMNCRIRQLPVVENEILPELVTIKMISAACRDQKGERHG
jgi:hypothetical protein